MDGILPHGDDCGRRLRLGHPSLQGRLQREGAATLSYSMRAESSQYVDLEREKAVGGSVQPSLRNTQRTI